MSISNFFNKTATQQRLTTSESSGRTIEDWVTTGSSISCNIQPVSIELITTGEGHFSNTHTIYTDDAENLIKGDRLTISNRIYQIESIQKRRYGNGRINHYKIPVIEIGQSAELFDFLIESGDFFLIESGDKINLG